jgi:hypothetical protein
MSDKQIAWTYCFNPDAPTRHKIELACVVIEEKMQNGKYDVRLPNGQRAIVSEKELFVRSDTAIYHLLQWLEEQIIHFTPVNFPKLEMKCGSCRSFVLGPYLGHPYCRKKKDRDVDCDSFPCEKWASSPGSAFRAVEKFRAKKKEMEDEKK